MASFAATAITNVRNVFCSHSGSAPINLIGVHLIFRVSLSCSSMASFAATMPHPSIYTNYVNVYLLMDKLDGTNYDTWT